MIEFSSRKRKTAEQKRNIKKGLKKFWDKKGRAVIAIGTAGVGAAALTLAVKSKGNSQKSMGGFSSLGQSQLSSGSRRGKSLVMPTTPVASRTLITPPPSTRVSSSSIVIPGAKSTAEKVGGVAGRAYAAGKVTATTLKQGIQEGRSGTKSTAATRLGEFLGKQYQKAKRKN